MSEEEQQDYGTPYRPADYKEQEETGLKPEYQAEESALREEEIKPEEIKPEEIKPEEIKPEQTLSLAEELSAVEQEIAEIQEKLADLKQRKSKLDEETEEFILLEDERKILRKNLIDLDFKHKELHKAYKRQNQENIKAEQAERQERINQEYSQKIAEIEKQEQTLHHTDRTNEEPKQKISQLKQQKAPEEQAPQKIENTDAEIKLYEEQLIEARHRARVAAIEAELASQKLRRSRQIELQAQIIRLRTDYPLYTWWSHYPHSYRFYPFDVPLYPSYLRYPYLGPLYPFYPIGRYYRYYPYI